MKNEEIAQEISEKYKHYNVECSSLDCYLSALEMAKRKDSQPQIIEIFGKRVKIVEDNGFPCHYCALKIECFWCTTNICAGLTEKKGRHFVEVDKNGKEINKQ